MAYEMAGDLYEKTALALSGQCFFYNLFFYFYWNLFDYAAVYDHK